VLSFVIIELTFLLHSFYFLALDVIPPSPYLLPKRRSNQGFNHPAIHQTTIHKIIGAGGRAPYSCKNLSIPAKTCQSSSPSLSIFQHKRQKTYTQLPFLTLSLLLFYINLSSLSTVLNNFSKNIFYFCILEAMPL
jgi:hypothetical protein